MVFFDATPVNSEIDSPIKKEILKNSLQFIEKINSSPIKPKTLEIFREPVKTKIESTSTSISFFDVPYFSQFSDISTVSWKKIGCGIASLNMLINYYKPQEITTDSLLDEGIKSGAYIKNAGWSHQGLALLAENHGLSGKTHDYSSSNIETAFGKLEMSLKEGPVIASVHYTFEPTNPIPHLVVINGIDGDTLNYSDPADGQGKISVEKFKSAWKKRYIEIRPAI